MEIQPKQVIETEVDSTPSNQEGRNANVVQAPQEMLEHFNIKPEDDLRTHEMDRLQSIWNMAKELFPNGRTAEILSFIRAVERQNPTYAASEQDRLFNVYKQFRIGTYKI